MRKIAKLILFSHSFKDSTHAANLIQYIATREGVEFNAADFKGEVTKKQEDLIKDVVIKFPELKELEEYNKFLKEKSKANASEFLTEAFNLIDDQLVTKEVYLKYISERPRVEKIHTHGLFNSSGEADLDKEIENIKNHKGVVWTHIVSLKREDAQRLGYDHLEQWQLLLKSKMQKVAESMNIELKNLIWNAAFHNEGHHPHVHIAMYSKDIKQGYLDQKGIKKIKSVLLNEIYKEELLSIKQEKSSVKNELKDEFKTELDKLYEKIITKNFDINKDLINEFIELSKMLPDKGKNVYGYQSKEIKQQVDKIVQSITQNKNIKQLYEKYLEYNKELTDYYSSKGQPDTDIVKDEEFKPLKNMILKSAKGIQENQSINFVDEVINNDNSRLQNQVPEPAPPETAEKKLKKLDNAIKTAENSIKSKRENNSNISDRQKVKEQNEALEKKEVLEMKDTSIKNIENKFCTVLNRYIENNEDFKTIVDCIGSIKNSYLKNYSEESPAIQKNVMSAVEIILNDPELKNDYANYIGACEDYSILVNSDKQKEINEGLVDFTNEVISSVNLTIQAKGKEIEELSGQINIAVQGVEDKFLVLLDKYGNDNIKFKNEINFITQANRNNGHDIRELGRGIDKSVSNALEILLSDPSISEEYMTLKGKCERYSMLSGKDETAELNNHFLDMKNEILNYATYSTVKYSEDVSDNVTAVAYNLNNLENSFLSVLDKYYKDDAKFKEELDSITGHSDYLYDKAFFDVESPDVEEHLDNLLNIIVNDEAVKGDYEKYIETCDKYCILVGSNKEDEINKDFKGMKNEILNCIYSKGMNLNGYMDHIKSKVIAGAKRMKKDYILDPKVKVSYSDYKKQDQTEIKYAVKSIVFDIVDTMYFSAKEGEFQKNKILRLNNQINRKRKKQECVQNISY